MNVSSIRFYPRFYLLGHHYPDNLDHHPNANFSIITFYNANFSVITFYNANFSVITFYTANFSVIKSLMSATMGRNSYRLHLGEVLIERALQLTLIAQLWGF